MNNNLLSKSEIEEILEQERLHPALKHPHVMSFGNERTSIIKISPINFIIFIKGDSFTGFNHIHERHDFWSNKYYWIDTKLETPTKFSRKVVPIIDYINIADKLYSIENLNFEKNKNPDLFDLYIGRVENENYESAEYRMLLYKGTKIIHTLFPTERKNKKKKIINYRRGSVIGEYNLSQNVGKMEVPYYNHNNIPIFSFIVLKNYNTIKEEWLIVNHLIKKVCEIRERNFDDKVKLEEEMKWLEFSDLSYIEKIIKQLDS